MTMQKETDWRVFINDREIHSTISKSIVAIQARVLLEARNCDLIQEREFNFMREDLKVALNSDIPTVSKLFRKPFECSKAIRGRTRTSLMYLPRNMEDQKSDYFLKNKNTLLWLKWRVREVAVLAEYLSEVRNINNHDTKPRLDFAWKIIVPSTVLRILELCPERTEDVKVYRKIRSICKEQIEETLQPDGEEVFKDDNTAEEEIAGYKIPEVSSEELNKINEKLGNILDILSTETYGKRGQLEKRVDKIEEKVVPEGVRMMRLVEAEPPNLPIEFSENEDLEDDNEREETSTTDEYPTVELLTPQMVRNKLNSLAKNHMKKYKDFEFDIPAENLLQFAVIEEILSGRPLTASEILTLPDVSWRLKPYKKSMKKQFKVLEQELNDILERAEWDE